MTRSKDACKGRWDAPVGVARVFALCWRTSALHTLEVLATAVIAGLTPPFAALFTKQLLDNLTHHRSWVESTTSIVAVGLVAALISPVADFSRAELQRRLSLHVPDRLFTALERLQGLAWFDDPKSHDRLQLAQQAGTRAPQILMTSGVGIIQAAVTTAGLIAVLVGVSPLIAGLLLVSTVPAIFAQLSLAETRVRVTTNVNRAQRRRLFFQMLLTDPHAAKEAQLFNCGGYLRARMLKELHGIAATERHFDRRVVRTQWALALLSAMGIAAATAWAASRVAGGAMSIGNLIVVLAAGVGIQAALSSIVQSLGLVEHAVLLFSTYLEVASTPAHAPSEGRLLPALKQTIEFEDVWFKYSRESPWVLQGLTVVFDAGRTSALVGLNGCGKSTLVKLLCRMYDPQKGRILWDGVDIREVDPASLRSRITAVFQDYMAYDLSAGENIWISDTAKCDDHLATGRAAHEAGISTFIEHLPRAYDTMLTRMFFAHDGTDDSSPGIVPSGGQWQRLALARGLLRRDADVMILDEPSSGLDANAEAEVFATVAEVRAEVTNLVISHRLGALRGAHKIYVLEGGRCIEEGDHAMLMVAGGRYAQLFKLQAQNYRLANIPGGMALVE